MIEERRIVAHGLTVEVRCAQRDRGYSAELLFEGGDRAIVDALTRGELDDTIEAIVEAAAAARAVRRDPVDPLLALPCPLSIPEE